MHQNRIIGRDSGGFLRPVWGCRVLEVTYFDCPFDSGFHRYCVVVSNGGKPGHHAVYAYGRSAACPLQAAYRALVSERRFRRKIRRAEAASLRERGLELWAAKLEEVAA